MAKPDHEDAAACRTFQVEVAEVMWSLGREHPMFDRLMIAITRHNSAHRRSVSPAPSTASTDSGTRRPAKEKP